MDLTGLTGEEHRSDRWRPGVSGSFEAGDTRRDRGACVGGKQGPMDVCLFDGSNHVLTIMLLHGFEL